MVSLQDLDKVSQRIKTGQLQAVKALHLVAYGTEAPPRQARKRVCEFRGFNLDKESDEFENKLSDVEEFELCDLVAVCNLLDLDYSGAKKEVVSRVCDFLNNLSSEDQNEKDKENNNFDDDIEVPNSSSEDDIEEVSSKSSKSSRRTKPTNVKKEQQSFSLTFRDVEV